VQFKPLAENKPPVFSIRESDFRIFQFLWIVASRDIATAMIKDKMRVLQLWMKQEDLLLDAIRLFDGAGQAECNFIATNKISEGTPVPLCMELVCSFVAICFRRANRVTESIVANEDGRVFKICTFLNNYYRTWEERKMVNVSPYMFYNTLRPILDLEDSAGHAKKVYFSRCTFRRFSMHTHTYTQIRRDLKSRGEKWSDAMTNKSVQETQRIKDFFGFPDTPCWTLVCENAHRINEYCAAVLNFELDGKLRVSNTNVFTSVIRPPNASLSKEVKLGLEYICEVSLSIYFVLSCLFFSLFLTHI
jgi:hypothetical protein